ncbi:EamA family transporter [Pueribacillus theae]|uniref:EamA family transporter n=2 Tax=Pueribacillus theae TaxID=2171751 RepID=A0A2U1JK78_9BACI|nr:EamA family transporter [Pueribacillus theae]
MMAVRLLTFALTLIWGASWILAKIGLDYMGPFTFSLFRFASGVIVLFLVLFFMKRLSIKQIPLRDLMILGLIQTAAVFLFVAYGMMFVDAGKTSVLLYTMPIWSGILAAKFLDEQLTGANILAMILGAAGLLLIVGFDLNTLTDRSVIIGDLFILIASVCWATANIFYQKKFKKADRLQVNAYQMLFGTIAMLMAALMMEWGEPIQWTGMSIFAILFTGIAASAISFSIWFYLLDSVDTATAAMSILLVPIFGLVFGAIFLGEKLTTNIIIGSSLILIGVVLTQFSGMFVSKKKKMKNFSSPEKF